MKNSEKHTYSSKYTDDLLLRGKALFEEKAKRELSMEEVREGLDGLAEFFTILKEWDLKEETESKPETQTISEPAAPTTKSKETPTKHQPVSTPKTTTQNHATQKSNLEKAYTLPISNITIKHKELFGNSDKVFLRPAELKNYGLPTATVNDMVYRASEMEDPFPFIKLGRKTLIPRVALEEWILRQAHVREK